METSQQHLGDTRTSAYTLPTPTRKQLKQRQRQKRKQERDQQQQEDREQRQQQHVGEPAAASTIKAASPLHSTDSHKEIESTADSGRSPSVPWLVEYWSSSFFRAPAFALDHMMCSCASTSMQFQDGDTASNNNNSIVSKNSYFDDTIVKSDPANVVRSPTKISPTRWEALRAVVASHGDFTTDEYDYCDFYESTVPSQDEGMQLPLSTDEEMPSADSLYNPVKTKPADWSKCRQSSILAADDSMEEDEDNLDDADDDIRVEPPASPNPVLPGEEDMDTSGRDLNTCHSFDQYIDTTRYLCAQREEEQQQQQRTVPATPTPATPPLAPPANRLPDRRRSRQIGAATNLAPRTLGFQRLQRSLQPPSPSTDTYTTISLSQSFAREFDDDDDSSEHMVERRSPLRPSPMTPPSNLNFPQRDALFLDRISAETLPASSPSRLGSPFRRLRPRTRANIEDEKKEDENEFDDYPSTPPRNPKKSSDEEEEEEDESAYRCLVRMSPDNYRHEKETSYDEWLAEDVMHRVSVASVASSASSSVLLPLHPHQRIIDPLPHEWESFHEDHSGYTCFRNEIDKQQQRVRVSSPVECS